MKKTAVKKITHEDYKICLGVFGGGGIKWWKWISSDQDVMKSSLKESTESLWAVKMTRHLIREDGTDTSVLGRWKCFGFQKIHGSCLPLVQDLGFCQNIKSQKSSELSNINYSPSWLPSSIFFKIYFQQSCSKLSWTKHKAYCVLHN